MYKASIKFELGEKAQDYFSIMDKKVNFKKSKAKVTRKGGSISIEVEAQSPVALVSTINSFMKQIRIIGGIEKLTEE